VKVPICVSIATQKVSDIPSFVRKAESLGADIAEIRLDYLKNLRGIEKGVKEVDIPLIATNRQLKQGGKHPQKEDERIKKLLETAKCGFSYVDMELTTPKLESVIEELKENGIKTIVSFHDFDGTPKIGELREIVHSQIRAGADVCKLVTTANKLGDNLSCLSLASEMSQKTKIVCFAMGEKGVLSRILSPLFGACFTYASLKRGMETASGQLSIQRLRKIYRCLGVEE